jgi:hypothetical protein
MAITDRDLLSLTRIKALFDDRIKSLTVVSQLLSQLAADIREDTIKPRRPLARAAKPNGAVPAKRVMSEAQKAKLRAAARKRWASMSAKQKQQHIKRMQAGRGLA